MSRDYTMRSLALLRATSYGLKASKQACFRAWPSRSFHMTSSRFEPLRILFCGSDQFSVASLQALHGLSKSRPDLVETIDVVCRPPKLTGRGLKTMQEVPIVDAAKQMELPLHQTDDIAEFEFPEGRNINIIIAVSFGLFIPARLIHAAKYGGLNVHPSMLPQYRGSAPLQRTIINGDKHSGVTVQTLDDKKFDHGVIIGQYRFRLRNPDTITYPELLAYATQIAPPLLVACIEEKHYEPPLVDVSNESWESSLPSDKLILAPKIKSKDKHINWHRSNALVRIDRRHRALGTLHSSIYVGLSTKRLLFHDLQPVEKPLFLEKIHELWLSASVSLIELPPSKQDTVTDTGVSHGLNASPSWSPVEAETPVEEDEKPNQPLPTPAALHDFDVKSSEGISKNFQRSDKDRGNLIAEKFGVYHMIDQASSGDKVPVFYIEEGDDIIVGVNKGAFRVKQITVDGDKTMPAAQAMRRSRSQSSKGNLKMGTWEIFWLQRNGNKSWFAKMRTPSHNIKVGETTSNSEVDELSTNRNHPRGNGALRASIDKAKIQRRLERIEVGKSAVEKQKVLQDVVNEDWSQALIERHKTFFPEAYKIVKDRKLKESPGSNSKLVAYRATHRKDGGSQCAHQTPTTFRESPESSQSDNVDQELATASWQNDVRLAINPVWVKPRERKATQDTTTVSETKGFHGVINSQAWTNKPTNEDHRAPSMYSELPEEPPTIRDTQMEAPGPKRGTEEAAVVGWSPKSAGKVDQAQSLSSGHFGDSGFRRQDRKSNTASWAGASLGDKAEASRASFDSLDNTASKKRDQRSNSASWTKTILGDKFKASDPFAALEKPASKKRTPKSISVSWADTIFESNIPALEGLQPGPPPSPRSKQRRKEHWKKLKERGKKSTAKKKDKSDENSGTPSWADFI